MAKDKNPNKVTRKEADELFVATATESLRKKKGYLGLHQAERDRNHAEAEAIVAKAKKKGKS